MKVRSALLLDQSVVLSVLGASLISLNTDRNALGIVSFCAFGHRIIPVRRKRGRGRLRAPIASKILLRNQTTLFQEGISWTATDAWRNLSDRGC